MTHYKSKRALIPGPPPSHGMYNLAINNVLHLHVRVVFVGGFGINVVFHGDAMATRIRRSEISAHEPVL